MNQDAVLWIALIRPGVFGVAMGLVFYWIITQSAARLTPEAFRKPVAI